MRLARRCMLALAVALTTGPALAADKTVTIGYQTNALPYIVGIQDGGLARATGWTIDFRRFNSGAEVFAAMAGGSVDMGDVGSSPFAAAVSNGIDVRAIYILSGGGREEQLVARDGSGIKTLADLRGKHLAAAPVSTDHYMFLSVLKQEGIGEGDVTFLAIPQPQIVAGWARGDIDAAFVWNPALGELLKNGKTLLTSGDVGKRGAPTFDALVVSTSFAHDNAAFLRDYVHAVDAYYVDYAKQPATWAPTSDNAKKLATLLGGTPAQQSSDLADPQYPTAAQQVSPAWLGGGAEGGVAKALAATAAFLKGQHKISAVLDGYGAFADPAPLASSVHAAN